MIIKSRVKQILRLRGMTQTELAERMGISKVGLCVILGPEGNPTAATIGRIAEALNVEVWQLFVDPAEIRVRVENDLLCPYCGKPIEVRLHRRQEKAE